MTVVVITGASAGLGRATARECAKRGYSVGLIARGEAGLVAAERECRRLGAPAAAWARCDVADAEAVSRAAADLGGRLGDPDIWINNAAVSVFARSWETTAWEFERVTKVNYLGTVYGTLAALEPMRSRRRGRIVQVGSSLAYRGMPLQAAYSAAKHAVQGFVDSLRAELLREYPGITVSTVQLPGIDTPLYSWMRMRMPRHPRPAREAHPAASAARAVLWAAERGVREVTVGGPPVRVRVLNAVAPSLADRVLTRGGYEDHMTEEPVDPERRRDNLDVPLDADRDWGADGGFGQDMENKPALVPQR